MASVGPSNTGYEVVIFTSLDFFSSTLAFTVMTTLPEEVNFPSWVCPFTRNVYLPGPTLSSGSNLSVKFLDLSLSI